MFGIWTNVDIFGLKSHPNRTHFYSSYAQVDSTENIITFRVISIVGASSEDPGTSVPFD